MQVLKSQQNTRLLHFLMKVSRNYALVKSTILMMQPLPNITQPYRLLCQKENHRNLSDSAKNSNEVVVFTAKPCLDYKNHKP